MDLSTNIIRNVYNIGTNSCDAGTQYCTNEYSLYFPCLKDVTRGQNVCFDFYVADGNTKDVVDLRTVDNISLNLNGQYNCSYGTFSYPDNIHSLQTEKYPVVYDLHLDKRELCELSVLMVDRETQDVINPADSSDVELPSFWSGTKIKLVAKDTPTHIFEGWVKFDDEEGCDDDSWEDYIVSKSNTYTFVINDKLTVIIALYRKRKSFRVVSGNDLTQNESSWFEVDYNHSGFQDISNRRDGFGDGEDYIDGVLEGYHMVAKCIPSPDSIDDSDSDNEPDMRYVFIKWIDGDPNRCRLFEIGKDMNAFIFGNEIRLRAVCSDDLVPEYELEDVDYSYSDEFDEVGVYTYVYNPLKNEYIPADDYSADYDIYDLPDDCENILSSEEVYKKYVGETGYFYFHFGTLTLSSFGIENGVKVNIEAYADDTCELEVKVNGYSVRQQVIVGDEPKLYEFYFNKCNNSDIVITTYGDCIVNSIEVCREDLVDGGKAQFCLDAKTTASIPPGNLSVNGAIAVGEMGVDENGDLIVTDAQAYGLASTQIGQVNKLPKIVIYG
jgi:hypothetical protein